MKTLDEIKKAVGLCFGEWKGYEETCGQCPYKDSEERCNVIMVQDVLQLIEDMETDTHRKAAAVTRLAEENQSLRMENPAKTNCTGNAEDTPDQTAKQDDGKLDLTLVPTAIVWCVAAVRKFGLTKYSDPLNWKRVEKARLRAAAFRHFLRYLRDPSKFDDESGLPHLWHLATNISFLCELEHYEGMDGLW